MINFYGTVFNITKIIHLQTSTKINEISVKTGNNFVQMLQNYNS